MREKSPDLQPAETKKYLVYVPQGKIGRLFRNTAAHSVCKIDGLYTDDFTTCCIIVFTCKTKIVLFHVDRFTMFSLVKDINEEISTLEEEKNYEIIALYKSTGQNTFKAIQEFLESNGSNINLQSKMFEDSENVYGLTVTFNHIEIGLPPYSKFTSDCIPENILHHPDEEKLLTVRTITQIIGKREFKETRALPSNNSLIFNGVGWGSVHPDEVTISTHPTTTKEMQNFLITDSYFVIYSKLFKMIQAYNLEFGYPVEPKNINVIAEVVSRQLENYLNNYDAVLILKKNMISVLNDFTQSPLFKKDKKLRDSMIMDFKNSNSVTIMQHSVNKLLEQPRSKFIQHVLEKFELLHNHYEIRLHHKNISQLNQTAKEKVKTLIRRAVTDMNNKKYSAANSLLKDALEEATRNCSIWDPWYIGAHSHLANSYYCLGQYKNAICHFKQALHLYELSSEGSRETQSKIESHKKLLADCQVKLTEEQEKAIEPGIDQTVYVNK